MVHVPDDIIALIVEQVAAPLIVDNGPSPIIGR